MTETEQRIFIGLYSLVISTSVPGNLVLVWELLRNQRWNNASNILFANLAAADILVGLTLLVVVVFEKEMQRSLIGVDIWFAVYHFFDLAITVSSLTLVCVAAHRYRLIVHPLKHKWGCCTVTTQLFAIWLVSIILTSLSLVMTYCDSEVWTALWTVQQFLFPVLQSFAPLVAMVVLYSRMMQQLKRRIPMTPTGSNVLLVSRQRENRSVAQLFLAIMVVFVIGTLPYECETIRQAVITSLDVDMSNAYHEGFRRSINIVRLLLGFNSSVHVLLYAVRHHCIRQDARRLWKSMRRSFRTSSDASADSAELCIGSPSTASP